LAHPKGRAVSTKNAYRFPSSVAGLVRSQEAFLRAI